MAERDLILAIAAFRPGRRQRPRWRNCRSRGRLCALWRGSPRRALHWPHAQPARTAGTAAAALGQAPAPPAVGRAGAADSLAAHRLGVRVAAAFSLRLLEKIYGTKSLERMHLGAPAFVRFLGGNRLSAHHGDQPPQPARGRLGLRAVPLARRGGALCRGGAQALPAAPLHRRSRPRSQPPRLRLLRDEDVPRALLQGLHGRALRRRSRGGRELPGHARRKPARRAPHGTRTGLGRSRIRVRRRTPRAGTARGERARPGRRAGPPPRPAPRRHSASLRQSRRGCCFPL